jgi:hypothetical protein
MGLSIPFLPAEIRASSLLHGSNADFVTNAYLALQRQWPDEGGLAHYLYALGEMGARRADVLREIASSSNARQCGVSFIDDLPPEHDFRPEDHDLRLARTAADVEQLRQAVSRLTAAELATAVETLIQAQSAHQALLESRLNALAGPAGDGATEMAALRAEVQALRAEVGELRAYATVDLKREVADYVNALHAASEGNRMAPQVQPLREVSRNQRSNVRSNRWSCFRRCRRRNRALPTTCWSCCRHWPSCGR